MLVFPCLIDLQKNFRVDLRDKLRVDNLKVVQIHAVGHTGFIFHQQSVDGAAQFPPELGRHKGAGNLFTQKQQLHISLNRRNVIDGPVQVSQVIAFGVKVVFNGGAQIQQLLDVTVKGFVRHRIKVQGVGEFPVEYVVIDIFSFAHDGKNLLKPQPQLGIGRHNF